MLKEVKILLKETDGFKRQGEPVILGIPFPKGCLFKEDEITLLGPDQKSIPCQTQVLWRWPDESIKWLWLDFLANVGAYQQVYYKLVLTSSRKTSSASGLMNIQAKEDHLKIDTGKVILHIPTQIFAPFHRVETKSGLVSEHSRMVFTDKLNNKYMPCIENFAIESTGPLKTVIRFQGDFCSPTGKELVCFLARLILWAGCSFCKLDFTVHNPKAARHPGGLWDLGDPNSVLFEDLSFHIALEAQKTPIAKWTDQFGQPLQAEPNCFLTIYQDSSGGENWQSPSHVNRFGKIRRSFCGYQVYQGVKEIKTGRRAQPVVGLFSEDKGIVATVQKFWQNFPKSLEVFKDTLTIRFFPKHYKDLFELQPGEQKTHAIFLDFAPKGDAPLAWVHSPLLPQLLPDWYAETKVFPYLTPITEDTHKGYQSLMQQCIEGPHSFFAKREVIDEYGWRNFGDLYADHENLYYDGPKPVISHYNNQYDAIYGFILQYVRSGDRRWWELAQDLARHVIDIDIYHTKEDKAAYNGGLFWHTDHYTDAFTSTHRTYSRKTMERKGLKDYGGGPSNEHLYTTGLLYYYLFTGDSMAKEAVIGLANWVIDMDDGNKTIFRFLCRDSTGLASKTGSFTYHGPGRGCGNAINALLDAFILTNDRKYLEKAEQLIRRCIHPKDDLDSLNLVSDPEHRWYYTAFLQVLGRYLDFKLETGELDYMFCYARESLLHYAKWMLKHEVPFKSMLDIVEYPTETWIVMDMRKSNVFDYAAKYEKDKELRQQFLAKAKFFYHTCLRDLEEFDTKIFTRPLVMLMSYGIMRDYFKQHPDERAPSGHCRQYDFGQPEKFIPQRIKAMRRAKWIGMSGGLVGLAAFLGWLLIW